MVFGGVQMVGVRRPLWLVGIIPGIRVREGNFWLVGGVPNFGGRITSGWSKGKVFMVRGRSIPMVC